MSAVDWYQASKEEAEFLRRVLGVARDLAFEAENVTRFPSKTNIYKLEMALNNFSDSDDAYIRKFKNKDYYKKYKEFK